MKCKQNKANEFNMDNNNEKVKGTVSLNDITSYILERMDKMPCDADSVIVKNEKRIERITEEFQGEILVANLLETICEIEHEFFAFGMKYGAKLVLELID